MVFWGFYFLVKLYLHYQGSIRIDVPWNLAFGLLLLLPLPKNLDSWKSIAVTRFIISLALAFELLWHDSWFAPLPELIKTVEAGGGIPDTKFLLEFIMRYFSSNLQIIAIGIGAYIACFVADRYLKLVPLGMIAVALIIPIDMRAKSQTPEVDLDDMADKFFFSESQRVVKFKKPASGKIDFDIVVLHICSLGWDDLKALGMEDNDFFKKFHYLHKNFNSVSSYSLPALTRLLHSSCGQKRSGRMDTREAVDIEMGAPLPSGLKDADGVDKGESRECSIFGVLHDVGFKTTTVLNHNGQYSNFANTILKGGHITTPMMPNADLPVVEQQMFYPSPINSNFATLEKWWKLRQQGSPDVPEAIYYNTVSLHDGSHLINDVEWWKRDPKEQYSLMLNRFLGEMTQFFDLLTSSGRNVVVVFIPEHGRALRGSAMQPSGVREFPLPAITDVPVGIRLFGPKYNNAPINQQVISKPSSLLSFAYHLAYYVENTPFAPNSLSPKSLVDKLPETAFMADNWEYNHIMQAGQEYYKFGVDKKWVHIPGNALK
jgi:hypothetical protein